MHHPKTPMVLLYLFANAKNRPDVNKTVLASGQEYLFFGMDYILKQKEPAVLETLSFEKKIEKSHLGKLVDFLCNKFVWMMGGTGGSFYKILRMQKLIRTADRIVTTADRVGIPLVLLMSLHFIPKCQIIYISIGLPEKIKKMRRCFRIFFIKQMRCFVDTIICYGYKEQILLNEYFQKTPQVVFVPFGVHTDIFTPQPPPEKNAPVVCIGADPNRDFLSLFILAEKHKTIPFSVVTSIAHKHAWEKQKISVPANISVQYNIPFEQMKSVMTQAKCVVLPVFENSYSGATTTLLQAMAMGKAVIVTKTGAIAEGYHLKHNENVLLIPPGDDEALDRAFKCVFTDESLSVSLGKKARETVEKYLTWQQYSQKMKTVVAKIE